MRWFSFNLSLKLQWYPAKDFLRITNSSDHTRVANLSFAMQIPNPLVRSSNPFMFQWAWQLHQTKDLYSSTLSRARAAGVCDSKKNLEHNTIKPHLAENKILDHAPCIINLEKDCSDGLLRSQSTLKK